MDPSQQLKKTLRAEALARRDALDAIWRIDASLGMADAADELSVEAGKIVSGFWPMRSEADIRPLMARLADRGGRLCLPAVLDKTTIIFRELVRGGELVSMGFGTYGPGPEAAELRPELMLVPLAAYDGRGHRIGYGAGYYDRAIAHLNAEGLKPLLVGVAFACQEIGHVPNEPHDMALDAILTENGLRWFATGL